jgi:hypothetical protein
MKDKLKTLEEKLKKKNLKRAILLWDQNWTG